eukprot:TRINITY_DN40697_c0_g1_i1.p1 TRINITY_DN40697_c0_g1~~TRINITY_DN40697_c0_g1_i1.p1  ORF type:complete len:710 (+),score=103.00 TRINITY_DN40697_c0_g1_i1:101-2230(+)
MALPLKDGASSGSGAIVPARKQGDRSQSKPLKDGWSDSSASEEEKRAEIREENLTLCCSIITFILFLTTFSTAMMLNKSASTSRLADHLRLTLNPSHFPVTSITNVDTMYSYLEQVIVPGLFDNTTDTQLAETVSQSLHPIDAYNRIMGTVRLRQARVKLIEGCQVKPLFTEYTISCYPSYTADLKSTSAFGPEGKFQYSSDSSGEPFTGKFASYTPDGFVQYLSLNKTKSLETIASLRREGFMDSATRAVFVEFNIFSSNVGVYAVALVAIEFYSTGGVAAAVDIKTMTQRVLEVGGMGSMDDWISFTLVVLVMLFVTNFLIEEIQELIAVGIVYLTDPWNLLDWVNCGLLGFGFIMRILLFLDASKNPVGKKELENEDTFVNISAMAASAANVRLLNAFNCVLLWGKITKYLRFLPLLKALARTVWSAFDLFLPFLIMFFFAFLGFVMAFNIGFGDKLFQLSTFAKSAVYLCRAFLRDVELMPVYDVTPLFGALLILLFYITMMLVGLALMFAMMADAMFKSKYSREMKEKEAEMAYWNKEEPLEEFVRSTKAFCRRMMIKFLPCIFFNLPSVRAQEKAAEEDEATGGNPSQSKLALQNGSDKARRPESRGDAGGRLALDDNQSEHSGYSMASSDGPKRITPEELLRAIEHMSGRVLSEITVVGIEIRSELHDVCERVAQMQMAIEELTWRTDKVMVEQDMEISGNQ